MTQTGVVHSGFNSNHWHINKDTGHREYEKFVSFHDRFETPPEIATMVTAVEGPDRSHWIGVSARVIGRDGFTMMFRTKKESHWDEVVVAWVATDGRV